MLQKGNSWDYFRYGEKQSLGIHTTWTYSEENTGNLNYLDTSKENTVNKDYVARVCVCL